MRTQIELITPIITEGIRTLADVRPLERADLAVSHTLIEQGPASIESELDEALSVPDTIRKAVDAEQRGANAILIDCMGDPGLHACREAVTIPVLGPGQTALHVAAMLGHRFSFITVLERLRAMVGKLVASYGLGDNFASFRAVDIPVLDIAHDPGSLQSALAREAIAAVRHDHADVIVLGCTGFLGCAGAMRQSLLAHSKRAYPPPCGKPVAGYRFPEFAPRVQLASAPGLPPHGDPT